MDKVKEHNNTVNHFPTCIVVFGGTGDLAIRSLYPSIFALHRKSFVGEGTSVIAYAHTEMSQSDLQEKIRHRLREIEAGSHEEIDHFVGHVHFIQGSFDQKEDFETLALYIDKTIGPRVDCNKLFYLSVAPQFFDGIVECLGLSGLADKVGAAWVRIGIEKPFGSSLESAQDLDQIVHRYFSHQEVFHVDHFLNKEVSSSVLFFRFANTIFSPIWNKDYVDKIEVVFNEELDVSSRGSFYDRVGAWLDVGQNHALALLSFVLMDRPTSFTQEAMGPLRGRALEQLVVDPESITTYQYQDYGSVPGVREDSDTETYFKVEVTSRDPKWQGVPLLLRGGKAVDTTEVRVSVYFNEEQCLCLGDKAMMRNHSNKLDFVFKPNARIVLSVWDKEPGVGNELQEVDFVLERSHLEGEEQLLNTYERVLHDMMKGEHTLFLHDSEIMAGWRLADEVKEVIRHTTPLIYKHGTCPVECTIQKDS